jgi:hypothetical protein
MSSSRVKRYFIERKIQILEIFILEAYCIFYEVIEKSIERLENLLNFVSILSFSNNI